jgi:hypothetical protein
MGMKIKTSTIIWLILGIIGSWFMGITAVSMGLGSLFPAINLVAKPFVCPGGHMEINSQPYQVSPVEEVTTLTWYCVDIHSGTKTELNPFTINFYAGFFYGSLFIVAVLIIVYFYRRWDPARKQEVKMIYISVIVGACLLSLIPLIPLIRSLTPESTTIPEATATSLASTFEALTLGKINDFSSTDKPLADWNGIPIMPEAIAGQQVNYGAYAFKVPVETGTMDTILSYYSDQLKPLGWNLADSRWAGMQFTKDKSVLLVTIEPVADTESWIVTLVFVP